MTASPVIFVVALVLLAPSALAQELRLELARKRQEVTHPAPAPETIVKEAERAVREYQERVRRERILEELRVNAHRRDLDFLITHEKQALAVQRALGEFRR